MMRDTRFVAAHRGGSLQKEQHAALMVWARGCAAHVLPLYGDVPDERLVHALTVAEAWARGAASAGEARQAAVAVHAVAREAVDPAAIAVARAAGHAVATAHMADHALGAALYALKAVNQAGRPVEAERAWQREQLPPEIEALVLSGMREKEKHFKI